MDRIKVLIVDDHAIVRMGLAALLGTKANLEVVGEADGGEAALRQVRKLRPDVVVMDIMMPGMDGITATAAIREAAPETKVLVLTTSTVSDDLAHALRAGAAGLVSKSAANSELVKAIGEVAAGRPAISPAFRDILAQDPPAPDLTPRQREILGLMVRGLTNKDIARELGIRPNSVNLHVIAILEKIGAANRTEAVAIALRKNLLKD